MSYARGSSIGCLVVVQVESSAINNSDIIYSIYHEWLEYINIDNDNYMVIYSVSELSMANINELKRIR